MAKRPYQNKASAAYMKEWRQRPENRDRLRAKDRAKYKVKRKDPKWVKRELERKTRYRQIVGEQPEFRVKASERSKAGYQRLRAALLALYGNKCSCCRETERMFLELDHVNGGGAKHYKECKNAATAYRQILALGGSPDYRLLCANCNSGRQRNGGICPHKSGDQ